MCTNIIIYACTYTYAHKRTHAHAHARTRARTHTHTCICPHLRAWCVHRFIATVASTSNLLYRLLSHTCLDTRSLIYTCNLLYRHIRVKPHAHTHARAHTHTHTHTIAEHLFTWPVSMQNVPHDRFQQLFFTQKCNYTLLFAWLLPSWSVPRSSSAASSRTNTHTHTHTYRWLFSYAGPPRLIWAASFRTRMRPHTQAHITIILCRCRKSYFSNFFSHTHTNTHQYCPTQVPQDRVQPPVRRAWLARFQLRSHF